MIHLNEDISNNDILATQLLKDILNPTTTSNESLLEYAVSKKIDLYDFDEDIRIGTHLPCTKMSDMKLDFLTWYEEGGSFIPGIFPLNDSAFSQRKTYVEFEDISKDRYIPIEDDQTSRRAVNELFCGNNDISNCVNKDLLQFFDKKYKEGDPDMKYSRAFTINLSSLIYEFLNNPPTEIPRVYIITACRSSDSSPPHTLLRQRSELYAKQSIGISCDNTCYLAMGLDNQIYCFLGWNSLQNAILNGTIQISTINIATEENASECIEKCGKL